MQSKVPAMTILCRVVRAAPQRSVPTNWRSGQGSLPLRQGPGLSRNSTAGQAIMNRVPVSRLIASTAGAGGSSVCHSFASRAPTNRTIHSHSTLLARAIKCEDRLDRGAWQGPAPVVCSTHGSSASFRLATTRRWPDSQPGRTQSCASVVGWK